MNRGLPGFLLWPELPQGEISESLSRLDEEEGAEDRCHPAWGFEERNRMESSLFGEPLLEVPGFGGLKLEGGPLERQGPAWLGYFPSLFLAHFPQPLHSISLLSTDGTQVTPGAHCPSPPGTGKHQSCGRLGGKWELRVERT